MAVDVIVFCPGCHKRNRVPAIASGRPRCPSCRTDLPWIVDADDDDFDAVAKASPVPVLIDLWASWCGPCRTVSPALEQLAADLAGRLKLVKVNVDIAPNVAARFGVQSVPTLVLMRRGIVRDHLVGARPAAELRAWVERVLDQ